MPRNLTPPPGLARAALRDGQAATELADWLEEQGDPRAGFLRSAPRGRPFHAVWGLCHNRACPGCGLPHWCVGYRNESGRTRCTYCGWAGYIPDLLPPLAGR